MVLGRSKSRQCMLRQRSLNSPQHWAQVIQCVDWQKLDSGRTYEADAGAALANCTGYAALHCQLPYVLLCHASKWKGNLCTSRKALKITESMTKPHSQVSDLQQQLRRLLIDEPLTVDGSQLQHWP